MKNQIELLEEQIKELKNELLATKLELRSYKSKVNHLNVELEDIIASVSQQLQLSLKIQKMLSPTEIPRVQGIEMSSKFIPGQLKGGNYFDLFEHKDKMKFSLFLSSCSGFNISALLLSILIKMTSSIQARTGNMPDVLIKNIYHELIPHMSEKEEVNLFYGVIDKRNYEFHFCKVGNFYSYLQSFGKETLVSLKSCAPSLKKEGTYNFVSSTLTLNPKDRIILISEGITLNERRDKKRWSEQDLIESVLSAPKKGVHELRNEILFKNENFLGTDNFDHDVTLLITEVKDTLIKLATE